MDIQATEHMAGPHEQQRPIQALFHVYEDEIFLGKRMFENGSLSIGNSSKADILLNHQSVEEIHAVVRLDGSRFILNNNFPDDGLRVNGLSVESVPLKSKDIIKIGPYHIHVEIEALTAVVTGAQDSKPPILPKAGKRIRKTIGKTVSSLPSENCSLVLLDRYATAEARLHAAGKLSEIYKNDHSSWLTLLSKERFVVKKHLTPAAAERLLKKLKAVGVCCVVEKEAEPDGPSAPDEPDHLDFSGILTDGDVHQKDELHPQEKKTDLTDIGGTQTVFMIDAETAAQTAKVIETTVEVPQFKFLADQDMDEEDEEEALWVAPFSLKDKLNEPAHPAEVPGHLPKHLFIIKTIGSEVADVAHLRGGKSYYIHGKKGARLFARQTAKGQGHVYFTKSMYGYIRFADQSTVDLDRYKSETCLYSRRKQIYRFTVPDDASVVLLDGDITYTVNHCTIGSLPDVKEVLLPKSLTWRHWAASFCFHLCVLIVAGILYFIQAAAPLDKQPRFVKIDPSLLKQLEMKKVKTEKPKPKKIPPPPKPEPQKVAKKTEPKKKAKPKPTPKTTASRKRAKKANKTAKSGKHPKAGGGFGKGNTTNRNINQTGLLSLLGNSKVSGPSKAIASVTNLDAVPSPGATRKNYTVGGIKGSLGTGKIAVTSDAILQTKGSTQVLRSAGASGPGRVAALQKGKTGKKQVQAMVTAKMTRTVKIQGGMSREAVKRVIDQHLNEITMCYETALLSNPAIAGRVVFEWKILVSGRVGEIKIVASNINSNEIHECIRASIKGWRFPKPTGTEVVVSYPFVFDLVAF